MTRESVLEDALREIGAMQSKAKERLKARNLVFDMDLTKTPVTEADKWQRLAFWLYTDLCEANLIARQALEKEEGCSECLWDIYQADQSIVNCTRWLKHRAWCHLGRPRK